MAFKPRKGDALLFWSVKPDGKTEDPLSEHEGCPVVRRVKGCAPKPKGLGPVARGWGLMVNHSR